MSEGNVAFSHLLFLTHVHVYLCIAQTEKHFIDRNVTTKKQKQQNKKELLDHTSSLFVYDKHLTVFSYLNF